MRTRRGLLIFCICIVALGVASIGVTMHLRVRRNAVILVTASLRACIVPRSQGDIQSGGVALLSSALSEFRRQYREDGILYFDAGNSLFGDTGQLRFAKEMPNLLKKWNCNAITLGYRDFEVLPLLPQLSTPILACNVLGRSMVQAAPSKIYEIRGTKIAVVGLIDPWAPSEQSDDINPTDIADEAESIRLLQAEVARLRQFHIDVLLVISSALDAHVNLAIADRCPGIDFILALSESHRGMQTTPNGTRILSPAWDGQGIGVIEIRKHSTAEKQPTWREVAVTSASFAPDPELAARIRRHWIDTLIQLGDDKVVGSTTGYGIRYELEHDLHAAHPAWCFFNRPIYNFVVDAIRDEYPRWHTKTGSAQAFTKPDVVICNSGAVEKGLPGGVITRSDLCKAIPYDNKLVALRMEKRQIVSILSSQSMHDRGVLLVSGIKYVWDFNNGMLDAEFEVENGRWEPLRDDRHYTVVLTDFLAAGGDQYLSSKECAPLRQQFNVIVPRPKDSPAFPGTVELIEQYLRRKSPVSETMDDRVVFRRSR